MSSIIKAQTLGFAGSAAVREHSLAVDGMRAPACATVEQPRRDRNTSHRYALAMLRRARQQALSLVAEAEAEAAQLREAARASGYAEGLQEGREAGLREGAAEGIAMGWGTGLDKVQNAFRLADSIIAAAEEEQRRMLADTRGALIELAVAIAEKIVLREIERDPDYYARLLASTAEHLSGSAKIVVRVHPDAVKTVNMSSAAITDFHERFQVIPDDSLALGDCVVENEGGMLDGRLSTRLASIKGALDRVAE